MKIKSGCVEGISKLGNINFLLLTTLVIFTSVGSIFGQETNRFDFKRVEDNSFLIEEAYNQEPGVIQHISTFQYMRDGAWMYTFTDEWPVPGRRHQLSATLPVTDNGQTGPGDIALNYRNQVLLLTRLAFSPRFSVLLPTGNYHKGLGAGDPGFQLSLPISFLISRKLVTHYNLGVTYTPVAKDENGIRSSIVIYNYGMSIILLLSANFNLMLETVGYRELRKISSEANRIRDYILINPGIRYAINFKSGLQIVPGLATPIGLISSKGEFDIFAYLSFEHPLWKPETHEKKKQ